MITQDFLDKNFASETFYADLETISDFADITDISNFQDFPNDWVVVITDVAQSTAAIAAGRYKDVNLLGACSIVAILNIVGELEIPFVFGGDGASLLIPPRFIQEVEIALVALQKMAKEEFKLELRTGIIPLEHITDNHSLKVAKLRVSPNYSQAILRGGGITYATRLIKERATSHLYSPQTNINQAIADYTGLECRWQDIPTRHDEIMSLIVDVTAPSQSQIDAIYCEVIQQIEHIYGKDIDCSPVVVDNLQLSFSKKNLASEARVFTAYQKRWQKMLYIWKLRVINFLGLIFMNFKIKIAGFNWSYYKQIVNETTDFKKFDDCLRMVISGKIKQRQRLVSYLDKQFLKGRLVYGIHISDRALMTCLVFERDGRQVHFIDGADGGYALAALSMKERMKS